MFELRRHNHISFSAHNEKMKQFRKAHVKAAATNPTTLDQHNILSITVLSAANCTGLDGGGSYSSAKQVTRATSLPLAKIAGYKLSPN